MSNNLRPFDRFIGTSPATTEMCRKIDAVAPYDVSVILEGESGTGKDLAARRIHDASPRAGDTYYPVNMGALSPQLVCSQLFGHERGAFTGATERRRGVFELAHRGTLFLDEIGNLDKSLQSNLLRVLETQRFQRVGGSSRIHADVRFITATNVDLSRAVAEGRFREDLYHRLNVFHLRLPPLRERGDDVLELAEYFRHQYAEEFDMPARAFAPEVIDVFRDYRWPGNVRELENLVLRMVITAEGRTIELRDLPVELSEAPAQ
jgi:DNA-binding NtrC family response regulator